MNSKQKIIIILLILVSLLFIGSAIYYYMKVQEQKEILSQRIAEKELIEHKNDSIYNIFSTADLNMVSLKGFVKSVEIKQECKDSKGEGFMQYGLKFIFDKEGNIADLKVYNSDDGFVSAKYDRDEDGKIKSVESKYHPDPNVKEAYINYFEFNYDNNGHINKIINQELFGSCGELEGELVASYSNYENDKGFAGYKEQSCGYGWSTERNGTIKNAESDKMDNWIKKIYSVQSIETDDFEESGTVKSVGTIEIERIIEYYSKEEIDFTKLIMK